MKRYFEFYNPTKTYMFPNWQEATPERVMAEYPAINMTGCVIGTDATHTMFSSIDTLSDMCNTYNIDDALTDIEILEEIERVANLPEPEPEPTAEERMASAMEYQNLLL